MPWIQTESFLKRLKNATPNKIKQKLSHYISHYPLRALQMYAYGLRRITGKAYPEIELSWIQKWQSRYILSGRRKVRVPKGYFQGSNKRFRVIDDVRPLNPKMWAWHTSNELPLPGCARNPRQPLRPWKTPAASFILRIRNGFVAPDGLVFDNNAIYRNAKWYYQSPPDNLPVIRFDSLITFIQLWSNSFVHFSFDTLPRLNLAYDLIRNRPDIRILVQDSPFIIQVFNALDIDPARIIFQKNNHVYSADNVYYPQFYNYGEPQKMGLVPVGSLDKVRKKLSGSSSQPIDQIVYLKRRQKSSRSVRNERSLLDSVRKRLKHDLSLTVFEPDDDWTRDKEMMKRARVVFGPHGGAWSNIVFCKEHTNVIEFIPLLSLVKQGLNERPCYYGLSCALNLKYWYIEPDNFEFDNPQMKMSVPTDEILAILEQLGILK